MSLPVSITISSEDIQTIMDMAGSNFAPSDIALQLGVPKKAFLALYNTPDSDVREAYNAGKLQTQKNIMDKQRELAEGGNITAVQIFTKEAESIETANIRNLCLFGNEAYPK